MIDIGEQVRVRDGTDEPMRGTMAWRQWKSRNIDGTLVAREGGIAQVDAGDGVILHVPDKYVTVQRLVPTLDDLKEAKWAEIKEARDVCIASGVETPKGRIDSGDTSQLRLARAAIAGVDVDWTMEDNSVVAHTAAEIAAADLLVTQHVTQCHATATDLRSEIMSATTAEEIDAISWP
jgi:hypothetical protein